MLQECDGHSIVVQTSRRKTVEAATFRYLDSELVDMHMAAEPFDPETLSTYQKMFNLSREELNEIVSVLAK